MESEEIMDALEKLLAMVLVDKQHIDITENLYAETDEYTYTDGRGPFFLYDGSVDDGKRNGVVLFRAHIPDLIAVLQYIHYGGTRTDD